MAVEPSLIASREYSTWKRRPSGEKVLEGGIFRRVIDFLKKMMMIILGRGVLYSTV